MAKKDTNLEPSMCFNEDEKIHKPLAIFSPEEKIRVGVYQGGLSRYDIRVRYRQKKKDGKWTLIRTPKHIHWAVDLLIKMHGDKEKIKKFLDFLIELWDKTTPIKSKKEREKFLDIKNLLYTHKDKIKEYKSLSKFGEYKIEFLILLAKLLMTQEKTNYRGAYMFKDLLKVLRDGEDIFRIVAKATQVGKKK